MSPRPAVGSRRWTGTGEPAQGPAAAEDGGDPATPSIRRPGLTATRARAYPMPDKRDGPGPAPGRRRPSDSRGGGSACSSRPGEATRPDGTLRPGRATHPRHRQPADLGSARAIASRSARADERSSTFESSDLARTRRHQSRPRDLRDDPERIREAIAAGSGAPSLTWTTTATASGSPSNERADRLRRTCRSARVGAPDAVPSTATTDWSGGQAFHCSATTSTTSPLVARPRMTGSGLALDGSVGIGAPTRSVFVLVGGVLQTPSRRAPGRWRRTSFARS